MGKRATVVRTETTTDDENAARAERDENLDVALFTDLGDTEDTRIDSLNVERSDPDEGFLGKLEPTATELDVFRQWGGSKYSIVAKNARGRILTRRSIKLAGDPIFMSEFFEARWRKQNGFKAKKTEGEATDGAYTAKELMAIIEAKSEAARADAETREEKRRREDSEREAKAKVEEREWRERMEKDKAEREERARKDQAERDERVRKEEREHRERMEHARREDEKQRETRLREDEQRREKEHERQLAATMLQAKESQEKNQQFFTNMLAMTKSEKKEVSDPMAQVTQILTLVEALKGAGSGEPQDAVTALLARLPETLQAAGSMVGGAIREAKGLPPVKHDADGDEEAPAPGGGNDGSIRLTGAAAAKVRELVTHLLKKGQDPEKVLVAAADYLMGKAPGAAVAAARAVEARKKAEKGSGKPGKRVARHAAGSTREKARRKTSPPTTKPASVAKQAAPAPTVSKPAGAP